MSNWQDSDSVNLKILDMEKECRTDELGLYFLLWADWHPYSTEKPKKKGIYYFQSRSNDNTPTITLGYYRYENGEDMVTDADGNRINAEIEEWAILFNAFKKERGMRW